MNHLVLENQILNAAIDSKDTLFFTKHAITRDWFVVLPQAYDLFQRHCSEYGETPGITTIEAATVDKKTLGELGFDYAEYESVQTTKRKMADILAKRELNQWLTKVDTSKQFSDLGEAIVKKTRELELKYGVKQTAGIDVMKSGHIVQDEYESRKKGEVGVKVPTPFEALNAALGGGFETGDRVDVIAFTNRGKSWIAGLIGETANHHGFKVVHAALEMSRARLLFRWHALRSYRIYGRGFSNRGMLAGDLRDEGKFSEYLQQFYPDGAMAKHPNYVLKTRADYPQGLTLQQIERDIVENDLGGGMYILDQLNLAAYHRLGEGMKEFSREVTGIFQKHNVVGVIISQANGDSEKRKKKEDDGTRILQAPDLTAYSETIAIIQDARTTLTFDSLDNKAILVLAKSTDGGVGTEIDLFWKPDIGEICEMSTEIERQLEAAGAVRLF